MWKMWAFKTAVMLMLLTITAHADCLSRPTLSQGSKGSAVSFLQSSLNSIINSLLVVDGDFGPITDTAVRNFQSFFALTVDGIVGPNTWSVLCSNLGVSTGSTCTISGNPHSSQPKGVTAVWNPIMEFIVNSIYNCFTRSEIDVCKTYIGSSSSDHPGNAADCYPYGKSNGDNLAQWAVTNRELLKVKYVIWYRQIWSRTYPYWRPYSGASPHTDHVHISCLT